MSLLDSTEKILDPLDSKIVSDNIDIINQNYLAADQASHAVMAKILKIILNSPQDSSLRQTVLPKTYSELIELKEKLVRANDELFEFNEKLAQTNDELVIERNELSDLIQAQRDSIHARDMKIRSYEIMLGWFVAELSKYKRNKEDIEKFVELNVGKEGSDKINSYAIQFEL